MLETLNRYIEEQPKNLRAYFEVRDNRRFAKLLALSIIGHLIFYAALIRLDIRAMHHRTRNQGARVELAQVAEIALPADKLPALRRAPDPIERADVNRLQFDPERADDINLINRSPRASIQRGSGGAIASAQQIERGLKSSRGDIASAASSQPQPPALPPAQISGGAQPDAPVITSAPIEAVPAPPVPQQRQNASRVAAGSQSGGQGGERRGDSSESRALGLQQAQAQYLAYIRAKIRKANERIMPRKWIEDVLDDKVSADFALLLTHGGQIMSARLARSTGYPTLDEIAKQAIYIAGPFEGWPPNAGDSLAFTVTVYYTPRR